MLDRRILILAVTVGMARAKAAEAQQFSPLTIKPKPNHIVAVDVSHEMALDLADMPNPGATGNRLSDLRSAFIGSTSTTGVMGLFRDEFLWGGFAYSGARIAKIKDGSGCAGFGGGCNNNNVDTRWVPPATQTPASIATSYANVRAMIDAQTPDYCTATKTQPSCVEANFPNFGSSCISATAGCTGDGALLEAFLNQIITGYFGNALEASNYVEGLTLATTITCDTGVAEGACDTMGACFQAQPSGAFLLDCRDATPGNPMMGDPTELRPLCELAHELLYFFANAPPRFDNPSYDQFDVRAQLCGDASSPVDMAFQNVRDKITACRTDAGTFDFTFTCSPTALASSGSNALCGSGSVLRDGVGGPCTACDTVDDDGDCTASKGECTVTTACTACDTVDTDGDCTASKGECTIATACTACDTAMPADGDCTIAKGECPDPDCTACDTEMPADGNCEESDGECPLVSTTCAACDTNLPADGDCEESDGECPLVSSTCAACDTDVPADGDCKASDGECPTTPSCVCDPSNPLCDAGGGPDDCGVTYSLLARQQVAMCYSHDNVAPNSTMYDALAAQTDNVVNGGSACRPNVITYLTDGRGGTTAGVAGSAPRNGGGGSVAAPWGVFRTRGPDPDGATDPMLGMPLNFVMVRASAVAAADTMQDRIQDNIPGDVTALGLTRTNAIDPLANTGLAKAQYARALNRNLRGTYSAANIAVDRFETRAAFFVYEVPGGPTLARDADSAYLGRPSRIAFHQIVDSGDADSIPDQIAPLPLWETDWSSKAGLPATIINSAELPQDPAPGVAPVPGPTDDRLGPGGNWADGVTSKIRAFAAGTLDRNGNATVVAAEQPQAVTWGYMLGGENAAPVIVEAPRDVPVGTDGPAFAEFQNLAVVRDRPRVIYAYTNGFIIGIHGGANAGGGTSDRISIAQTYDDAAATAAGTELFRIRPSFIYATGNPSALLAQNNEALQQPLMNGHMTVREIAMGAGTFSTLLVATQGSAGRGLIAVDVSDPDPGGAALPIAGGPAFNAAGNGPRVLWEELLPDASDRATSKPVLYTFPGPVSVVLMTGGAGGTPNLYALRADNGDLFSTQALTAGGAYRTAPSCVDTEGRGVMRYCYVVRGDGRLERISIDQSTGFFNGVTNITPGGANSPVGGSRQFWTEPVLTFGRDNSVNIFYASGNVAALAAPDGSTNRLFKIVDQIDAVATPAVLFDTGVCVSNAGDTSGVITFANDDEMVVSPPTLAKGVLAFTTYRPAADGCTNGSASLYALNVETCADAAGGGAGIRPAANGIGAGVPTSPTILRRSEGILTHTSAQPTGDVAPAPIAATTKGGRKLPLMRGYWLPWRIVR